MTHFERTGHWRTSKYGNVHWVSGGDVYRDDWDRRPGYSLAAALRDRILEKYPYLKTKRRVAFCLVNPNARCPECDAPVYYYQNEYGSRVFFDDLGPPWPKHPCTDSRALRRSSVMSGVAEPTELRASETVREIEEWLQGRGINIPGIFESKHGIRPWPLAKVMRRDKGKDGVFLVLKTVGANEIRLLYVSCRKLPKSCRVGSIVATKGRRISFFESSSMAPVELQVRRYRGANAFLLAMIGDLEPDEG